MVSPCPSVDAPTDERLPIDVKTRPFRYACAWCKAHISGPADGETSHGICGPCGVKWTAGDAVSQQAV